MDARHWRLDADDAPQLSLDRSPAHRQHARAVRVRKFDVNQVVAFAVALDMPLSWFLMPPPQADLPAPTSGWRADRPLISFDRKDRSEVAISCDQMSDIALSRLDTCGDVDQFQDRVEEQAPRFVNAIKIERMLTKNEEERPRGTSE